MKRLHYTKASSFFNSEHRGLKDLFSELKKREALNQQFIPYLPSHLQSHCFVTNIVKNCIVILVSNASIATQLRFQAEELLEEVKKEPLLKNIQELKFKVHPVKTNHFLKADKKRKINPLSIKTAEILKNSADSLSDSHLKEIMKKIAKHV